MRNNILHGYIEAGETVSDAIARLAVLAGQNGCNGYELRCRECNKEYGDQFVCDCTRKIEKKFTEWVDEGGRPDGNIS